MNKEFEEFMSFVNAAHAATEDKERAKFECPLCGATAQAVKASNGHVYAQCKKCRMSFME